MDIEGPLKGVSSNISDIISNNSAEIAKSSVSVFWEIVKPIIELLGGLLFLYIIYRIVQGISNHIMKKRIKRIEKNVEILNGKVDEILSILKNKKKQVKLK